MNSKRASQKASPDKLALDDELISNKIAGQKQKLKYAAIALGLVFGIILIALIALQLRQSDTVDPVTPPSLNQGLTEQQKNAYREQFKIKLVAFEKNAEPLLQKDYVAAFNRDEVIRINTAKDAALAAFARAQFDVANTAIEDATARSAALIGQWQASFEQYLAQANEYFTSEQISDARFAYQQAKQLNPEAEEIATLGARLAVYDKVEALLARYRAAVAENNLDAQISALQQALSLDPARQRLLPLLTSAKSDKQKNTIDEYVKGANRALAATDLATASNLLQQASSIDANDAGVKAAMLELERAKLSQSLNTRQREIERSIANDNWSHVAELAQTGLVRHPGNTRLQSAALLASQITQGQQQLTRYQQRTRALQDAQVRQQVKSTIEGLASLREYSPSLNSLAETLSTKITKLETPVTITLLSDGNTEVTVFKVAELGKFTRVTRAVLPGTYRIEGKCDGFRTVQKTLVVVAEETIAPLQIQCEERI